MRLGKHADYDRSLTKFSRYFIVNHGFISQKKDGVAEQYFC